MRKDYFNDPDAPQANAAVPSVTAVVVDAGRLLLVHRADNDLWALPGGGHEVGESIEDTVVWTEMIEIARWLLDESAND